MAERSSSGGYFVQCGVTALRDAKGRFLPAVPIYIRVPDNEVDQNTGLAKSEKYLLDDIGGILAQRFKQYTELCEKLGLTV